MKPSRVRGVLEALIGQRWPAFIWGPPGVGKSSIVHALAQSRGLPVIDLRASLLDPTDLRGIPAIEGGRAVWCPPSFLPGSDDRPGILFLDEINAAPPLVQASLYQLVLDRRIGEYALPAGWWIVAAGNRQQDRAVTFRMSSALANRFVHLSLDPDVADWRDWAVVRGIHPLVRAFIALRPALLWQEPGEDAAYPTPRSWEMVSDMLSAFDHHDQCSDVLPGVIGPAAAIEFAAHVRQALSEQQMQALVDDPDEAHVPDSLDGLYVLTAWLAAHAADDRIVRASARVLGRLPPEFGVLLARDLLKTRPDFAREPGYRAFMKQHGPLIAR
jgi:MoxR-like ATPase